MPQSPSLRRWCAVCTEQASCITRRWKNLKSSLFLSFSEMSTGIRARPPEYWACTGALWFAAFESCTSTIALSAMPNAVPHMALAHRSRIETSDDCLSWKRIGRFTSLQIASKSERSDLPPLPGIVARLHSSTHERPQSVINLRVFLPAKDFTLLH